MLKHDWIGLEGAIGALTTETGKPFTFGKPAQALASASPPLHFAESNGSFTKAYNNLALKSFQQFKANSGQLSSSAKDTLDLKLNLGYACLILSKTMFFRVLSPGVPPRSNQLMRSSEFCQWLSQAAAAAPRCCFGMPTAMQQSTPRSALTCGLTKSDWICWKSQSLIPVPKSCSSSFYIIKLLFKKKN